MQTGRERERLHRERQVSRENCQSPRFHTSHQCLPPPHPIKSTLSLALPLTTPCSRVCAAKEGVQHEFLPIAMFRLPAGAGFRSWDPQQHERAAPPSTPKPLQLHLEQELLF